jgi:hypothetical protein
MVQLLPCTIMRSKSLVNYCLVQGSSCTISPSQRRTSVLMCKSSAQVLHGRRLANDSQYHISRDLNRVESHKSIAINVSIVVPNSLLYEKISWYKQGLKHPVNGRENPGLDWHGTGLFVAEGTSAKPGP